MASADGPRVYENIEARDNARMHNGDVHNSELPKSNECSLSLTFKLLKDYSAISASQSYFSGLPETERQQLLLRSVAEGQVRRATLLLQAGTNPDCRTESAQFTPLMLAAMDGHEGCLKILLEYGADINALSASSVTALVCAAENKHIDIVKLLLAEKISLKNALHLAVLRQDSTALVVLLEERLDVNSRDEFSSHGNGETPLITCARLGASIDFARALLEANADVDAQDINGNTALMHACGPSAPKPLVQLLMDQEANLNIQNVDGWTALMTACWNKEYSHAAALLRAGAAVDLNAADGRTALMMLHERNDIVIDVSRHREVHIALLRAGANPDEVRGHELHLIRNTSWI